jgi:hypothetical protein
MREQERFQSMPCTPQILAGSRPRAGEIPECFVFNAGHVHGRQIVGAQRARQLDGITPVGFYALARLTRDQ